MSKTTARLVVAFLVFGAGALGFWLAAESWQDADSKGEASPEPLYSGAYEGLAFWAAQRAYPGTTFPSEGFAEAVAARKVFARGGGNPETPWQAIGPRNVGGRTLALVLNPERPETVWAGSAGGGLWRSYSGGTGASAWARVSTGFGVTAASAVALAPGDTSTVYLGTGEVYRYQESTGGVVYRPTRGSYGMGILKSTDGGATWAKSLDWSRHQERGVQMIRVDPTDADVVWAATTEGVYVSRDGGATWAVSLDVVMATDLSVDPEDPDDVLAACGNQASPGYGLYRTTDGGESWTQVTEGVPPSYIGKVILARHPSATQTVYASVGNGVLVSESTSTTLIRTDDGGATWETVSTLNYGRYQGWFAHYVGINPIETDVLYLGGVPLFRSDDGGATTTELSGIHVDHHAVAFHPTDPRVVYFANDGGVWRTVNRGASMQDLNGGYQTTQFYNGTAVAADNADRMIGGLQDNGTVRYNGNPNWSDIWGGDGAWCAIDPENSNIMYASSQRLNMVRSTDGGSSFGSIAPPATGSDYTAFIAPYALAPSRPAVLYAARSGVYSSPDRGLSWTNISDGALDPNENPALALTVAPSDAGTVYVSTAPQLRDPVDTPGPPRLFVTRNSGISWSDITLGLPDRFINDIAVHPTAPQRAWVAVGGFGTPHVFKTEDAGATWTDVTGSLPDAPTNAVAFDPLDPATVFIGNDVGVFVTRDAGASWASFNEALPDAVLVMDLVYSPDDRSLRVATHGNGIYTRPLNDPPVATEDAAAPATFALAPPSPNPFRSATTLTYSLDAPSDVRLDVFDAAGRRVAVLAEGPATAGEHRARFEASGLASGLYIARLHVGDAVHSQRLTVVR